MRKYIGGLWLWLMVGVAGYSLSPVNVPNKYYSALVGYCSGYDVPIYYASRLIEYESGWDAYCVNTNKNGTKDFGIMQLNSAGIKDLERWHNESIPIDVYNWEDNMRLGIKHLRYLYELTGSWWGAITAYNMGYKGYSDFIEGKRKLPASTKKELDYVFG